MKRDDIIRLLMATYLEEFGSLVAQWGRDVLALEQATDPEVRRGLLRELMRTAHSLKGASRSVDVTVVERGCHHLEELIGQITRQERPTTPAVYGLLLQAGDLLGEARSRLTSSQGLEDSPLSAWLPTLGAVVSGEQPVEEAVAVQAPARAGSSVSSEAERQLKVSADRLDTLAFRVNGLHLLQQRLVADLDHAESVARMVEGVVRSSRGRAASAREVDLAGLHRAAQRLERALAEHVRELDHHVFVLRGEVQSLRMMRASEICEGFSRQVRDLATELGKDVRLQLEGGEVEIDRSVATALRNPLRHIVRNAVGHGIELPAERVRAGKPPTGTVWIRFGLLGGQCEVEVRDDGAGLDVARLVERARRGGLEVPERADERARLIFHPGLSTASEVTSIQGRGMGLDIVRADIERIHGTVDVASGGDGGTSFRMLVPLSASSIPAVLVRSAGQVFAVPFPQVERVTRVPRSSVKDLDGRRVVAVGGRNLQLVSLAELLEIGPMPSAVGGDIAVVVLRADAHWLALAVDGLVGEQDIVVKGLGGRIRRARHFNGATVLGDGRIALILSAADLIRAAFERGQTPSVVSGWDVARRSGRILIVDDSVTTRAVLRMLLEGAGYEVTAAVDGEEGWSMLQHVEVDVVVSDVEMPRLDGLGLLRRIRASSAHAGLPVILVTGLANELDRHRGLEAGANAYLVKTTFDQTELLQTLRRLM